MRVSTKLSAQIDSLPRSPGVYLFSDAQNRIMYVGKAKNLSSRVRSYFQPSRNLEPGKESMVPQVATIETIVTPSESDALIVEATLIKKHQPPYNVILKDDKFFLYIRVTLSEEFPTVDLVRSVSKKSDAYFGPYASASAVRETVKTLKRMFKFRTCVPHQGKPCFDYSIGRCLGPCVDAVTKTEYHEMISDLIRFLRGHDEDVESALRTRMNNASRSRRFEYAATLRDRIAAIHTIARRHVVISQRPYEFDVLGVAKEKKTASVAILQIRAGKLVNKMTAILSNKPDENEREILEAFIAQYYNQTPDRPNVVYTELIPRDTPLLARTFQIRVTRPTRGSKAHLVGVAHANAAQALHSYFASFEKDTQKIESALSGIKRFFSLPRMPLRIESFDVANIQGLHAVGSMVVFMNGKPERKLYKRFTIKTVASADDPAMMGEIISRRLARLDAHERGWERPDLIIIDGGKGQLSGIRHNGILAKKSIPVFALAKGGHRHLPKQSERERFFSLENTEHVLPSTSQELYLLERIRDEAHRFAISHYRGKHEKSAIQSELQNIPGIGPKRRKELLRHFGSIASIIGAEKQELIRIIGRSATKKIYDYFKFRNVNR